MKKFLVIVSIIITIICANAVVFAAPSAQPVVGNSPVSNLRVTNGISDYIGIASSINAPMIVKTINGDKVSGFHRFKAVEEMDSFLKGKDNTGLRVTNSHNPKRNIIVMNARDAELFAKLAKIANNATAQQVEGPTYQVEPISTQCPEKVLEKLNKIGIDEPIVLIVDSGKKVQPGGALGGFQRNFLNPVRMVTGIYNDVWSVLNWN